MSDHILPERAGPEMKRGAAVRYVRARLDAHRRDLAALGVDGVAGFIPMRASEVDELLAEHDALLWHLTQEIGEARGAERELSPRQLRIVRFKPSEFPVASSTPREDQG